MFSDKIVIFFPGSFTDVIFVLFWILMKSIIRYKKVRVRGLKSRNKSIFLKKKSIKLKSSCISIILIKFL